MATLERFGQRLLALRPSVFVGIVVLIATVKSTFHWAGIWRSEQAVDAFPGAVDEFSSNLVGMLFIRAGGGSALLFAVASIVALGAAVAVPTVLVYRRGPSEISWRIALILMVTWPIVNSDLAWFGYPNATLPLAIALTLLSRTPLAVTFGILLGTLTHPEHFFSGFVLLLPITLLGPFRHLLRRCLMAAAIGGGVSLIIGVWLTAAGVGSRLALLLPNLRESLFASISAGVLGVYAWWGLWWLVILWALMTFSGRQRVVILLSSVLLPAVLTVSTLDGTRVFTAIAAPVGMVLAFHYLGYWRCDSIPKASSDVLPMPREPVALGLWTALFLLLPNVQVGFMAAEVLLPGGFWVQFVRWVYPW